MKKLMLGNEAVARGAYEAGCTLAAAYPGTPATQILENAAKYEEIYGEWATNEKVAVEIAIGASMAGTRAMASMKHFGFHVASDPVYTSVYNGVTGGLIYVVADDPGLNSSGTEPDSRRFGPHMKLPIIEPSDSQECRDFVIAAFQLSEEFDTPFMVRLSTRICHGSGVVKLGERTNVPFKPYNRDVGKNTTLTAFARRKHEDVEERLVKLAEYSDHTPLNRIEWGNREIGIITNGISYQYAKEVFGETASYLKIGFSYPMPEKKIREFAAGVKKVYVIEELDPYMEEYVKQLGISCVGKSIIPRCRELTIDIVKKAFEIENPDKPYTVDAVAPSRPPGFCSGCTHRGFYAQMKKYLDKVIACGDIGCYNLSMLPPFSIHETMQDMGGSIPTAIGFWKVFEQNGRTEKPFAYIGDSTFFHSGLTGLADAVYRRAKIVVVILDNSSTAMTGHQEHVGTGYTIAKASIKPVSIENIVRSFGVEEENLRVVDPYNLAETDQAIKDAIAADELFVIVTKQPCPLLKTTIKAREGMYSYVDQDVCRKCHTCINKTGCPALTIEGGNIVIEKADCNGCAVCVQICPFKSIKKVGAK